MGKAACWANCYTMPTPDADLLRLGKGCGILAFSEIDESGGTDCGTDSILITCLLIDLK
jgi:hypothetical protein